MGRACSTHGRDENCTQNLWENVKVKDHLGDLDIGGMIILK
jgi:hypothetical protein